MVPRAGVEPTTLSLGRICSIQLSYRGILLLYHGSSVDIPVLASKFFTQRRIAHQF